jgi:hypothetical protein
VLLRDVLFCTQALLRAILLCIQVLLNILLLWKPCSN